MSPDDYRLLLLGGTLVNVSELSYRRGLLVSIAYYQQILPTERRNAKRLSVLVSKRVINLGSVSEANTTHGNHISGYPIRRIGGGYYRREFETLCKGGLLLQRVPHIDR